MKTLNRVHDSTSLGESTFGDLLRRTAYAPLPARFYDVLQVCAPFAVQFWLTGAYRCGRDGPSIGVSLDDSLRFTAVWTSRHDAMVPISFAD